MVAAVKKRMARPGIIYMLESPSTGRAKAMAWIAIEMVRPGFDFVFFMGPWWDDLQE